ncbi:MAG: type II toxin-antitoxin system HicA family toxin [Candidatus Accumulibacter sp.]|nr:type II toxin-antitoxin system HicA family toxin [Accumulibacter sp.]
MSHKHLHLLRSIFSDPPSANIHWREVESLLVHCGADIESAHGARFRIVLNHFEFFMHHPHNNATCPKQEIKQLREFLARAGVTPSAYEMSLGDRPDSR